MERAAALIACILMVSGAGVFLAGDGQGGPAPSVEKAGVPAPSLVPPAPGTGYTFSEPFHGLNRSRHPPAHSPAAAVTGSAKLLVILINLNDTTNSSTHTPKYFTDLIFNASQNSMNKYYKDNSYNMFCITGNVTVKFYTATHNLSWYGRYETSSPPPSGYGNAQNLTYDAVMAADADINYADYDQDNDGNVDHLLIVHAGGDQAYTGVPNDIWSHAWAMKQEVQLDGKKLYYYTMLSENDPVGIYVHEFGHDIGMPDLYDTDYSSTGGVGRWDVMASGSWNNNGNTPAQFSAWCKQELGWTTPTLVTVDTAGLTAKRVEDNSTGAVYKIWVNLSDNEYFLVENRQQVGWDANLPGNGLLIWHVNESAPDNDDGIRDIYRWVDLEEYDNDDDAADVNDPWRSNSLGFTPATSPNSNDYSGRDTGIRIFNISASGNTMIFDVSLANVAPNAPIPSSPGDASWTNLSKPVLSWTFSDTNLGDSQSAYRVQADDDNAFGSVNWDSGDTAGSSTTCTVGSALSDGKWYWRVRTRDAGSLWGPYNSATVRNVNIDTVAPAAPVGPATTPAGWTASNSFSVDWSVPAESGTSGIAAGTYYKLDSAPAGSTDGTWSATKPLSGITVSGAGAHTIYLWLKDGVGNVNYQNRSSTTLYFDNVAPANPTSLSSTTHTVSAWSNLSVIQVQWAGASDANSGVDGFSYQWDGSPATIPDNIKDCEETVSANISPPRADGTWYFHIMTMDNVGNWATGALHLGPFYIDLTPPEGVDGASSTSHLTRVWSNRSQVTVQWWGAADSGSGVSAYSFVWDRDPLTLPDTGDELLAGTNSTSSPPLGDTDGYYFHIRVRDACGNWNSTACHLGPFNIDTAPPANPSDFRVLSGHVVGSWSSKSTIIVSWSGQGDSLSGVEGYSIVWDGQGSTSADDVEDLIGVSQAQNSQLFGSRNYIHIRTRDVAGNWNESTFHIGPFLIDVDAPSQTNAVAGEKLTRSPVLTWTWPAATDAGSGVAGYQVRIVLSKDRPDDGFMGAAASTSFTIHGAGDGKTYYLRVRAVDNAGNLGEWGSFSDGILVDLSPPRDLSISINGGKALTNNSKLSLALSARDDISGLADMRFSQNGTDWTAWTAYAEGAQFDLSTGDGPRAVYFQVRDMAGNEARPVKARITLDTAGPSIALLEPEQGPMPVNYLIMNIRIEAWDALSGTTAVRLGPDGKSWGEWLPYGRMLEWELSAPDGIKEVFAQAMDGAGNAGPAGRFTVTLDTRAPGKPAVTSTSHPRSDTWYSSATLQVRWTAPADDTGIAGYSYVLSTAADAVPGERVETTSTELSLPVPGEGRWHFRVRAMDGAGNWGEAADYLLLIDTAGPAPPLLDSPANGAQSQPGPMQLAWRAGSDAQSGVRGYYVQVADNPDFASPVFDGVLDATGYTTRPLEQGNYYWHVRARDGAGNWGLYSGTSAFLVRKPVAPTPETARGLLDLSSPLMLLVIVIVLAAVIGGVAAAARRKKKEPPAEASAAEAGSPVKWE